MTATKEKQRLQNVKQQVFHTTNFVLRSASFVWSLFQTELVRQVGPGLPPEPLNNKEYMNRIHPWVH